MFLYGLNLLFYGSSYVTKKGLMHGLQMWFCKVCGRHFSHLRTDSSDEILRLGLSGKLSSQNIANQLGVSRSAVCRRIRSAPAPCRGNISRQNHSPNGYNVLGLEFWSCSDLGFYQRIRCLVKIHQQKGTC